MQRLGECACSDLGAWRVGFVGAWSKCRWAVVDWSARSSWGPFPHPKSLRSKCTGERHLAAELRGIGVTGAYEVPEWKKQALGKAPTFGIRDSRSIKDQRESLPIFKLKEQLVEAINAHQVGFGACSTGFRDYALIKFLAQQQAKQLVI